MIGDLGTERELSADFAEERRWGENDGEGVRIGKEDRRFWNGDELNVP